MGNNIVGALQAEEARLKNIKTLTIDTFQTSYTFHDSGSTNVLITFKSSQLEIFGNIMNTGVQILLPLLFTGCVGSTDSSVETSETSQSETGEPLLPPEALTVTAESRLLVPSRGFMSIYDNDGKEVYEWNFTDIVDSDICEAVCYGEGVAPDANGFLVSYVRGGTRSASGVMRFSFSDGELVPQWQRNDFETYVHDAIPMPKTEAGLIVLETLSNKISWFAEKSDSSLTQNHLYGKTASTVLMVLSTSPHRGETSYL
jgi:hypothetical protein